MQRVQRFWVVLRHTDADRQYPNESLSLGRFQRIDRLDIYAIGGKKEHFASHCRLCRCCMATKRILLIDDEKSIRLVVQVCLNQLTDWTVLTAASSVEGLRQAETEKPDAILLDLMMPDMDGFTVLKKLKENPKTSAIPVILLTAKVRQNGDSQTGQWELAGLLSKPFDPLNLANQIAEILNWQT